MPNSVAVMDTGPAVRVTSSDALVPRSACSGAASCRRVSPAASVSSVSGVAAKNPRAHGETGRPFRGARERRHARAEERPVFVVKVQAGAHRDRQPRVQIHVVLAEDPWRRERVGKAVARPSDRTGRVRTRCRPPTCVPVTCLAGRSRQSRRHVSRARVPRRRHGRGAAEPPPRARSARSACARAFARARRRRSWWCRAPRGKAHRWPRAPRLAVCRRCDPQM